MLTTITCALTKLVDGEKISFVLASQREEEFSLSEVSLGVESAIYA